MVKRTVAVLGILAIDIDRGNVFCVLERMG